jgi:hypothetical protein
MAVHAAPSRQQLPRAKGEKKVTATMTTSPSRRVEGYAIASIVFAVSGLLALPVIGSVLGLVFGKRALRNIEAGAELDGGGMAQAGIIVSRVGLVVAVIALATILVAFGGVMFSGAEPSGMPVPVGR